MKRRRLFLIFLYLPFFYSLSSQILIEDFESSMDIQSIASRKERSPVFENIGINTTQVLKSFYDKDGNVLNWKTQSIPFKLNIDIKTFGLKTKIDSVTIVWSMTVKSKTAIGLNFGMSKMYLSEGSRLVLFPEDLSFAHEYITIDNAEKKGKREIVKYLSTILDDVVYIELYEKRCCSMRRSKIKFYNGQHLVRR